MKRSTSDHQAGGFTMVELAMALVVLGIVAAVAIPNITSWRQNFALRNASQEVLAMLMQAKSEAMRRNRSCMVRFNVNHDVGQPDIQVCIMNCTQPTNRIAASALSDGVRFTGGGNADCQAPLEDNAIVFRANSLPKDGQCGSIYLVIGQRQARVEINRTGNISIY